MPRMARLFSMTAWSRALPCFERCERPRQASASASGVQPGRLAQGPEEKQGFRGRVEGFMERVRQLAVGRRGPSLAAGGRRDARSLWIMLRCVNEGGNGP